jgi:hypothetical protein
MLVTVEVHSGQRSTSHNTAKTQSGDALMSTAMLKSVIVFGSGIPSFEAVSRFFFRASSNKMTVPLSDVFLPIVDGNDLSADFEQ